MVLVVLALDAVDARLVEEFECENLKLQKHTEMTTIASKARGTPHTLEVWPSIATGVRPEEHGVAGSNTSSWNNPLLDFISQFTGVFSEATRARLGRVATRLTGTEFSSETVEKANFLEGEGRVVREWPGITDAPELIQVWKWVKEADSGDLTTSEFERNVMGTCGAQFGWVRELGTHQLNLVASHVHTVDAFGHPYATDRERLRHFYHRLDEYVGRLRNAIDGDILIVSDHGMKVEWLDEDPGEHSWHAFASTTTGEPPTHALEVRDWVESHVGTDSMDEDEMDMPTETLRQLGYLE